MGLAIGKCLGLFYADDGVVRSRDTEWLQVALNMLIGIFCWYRLVMNVAKSKTAKCQTGTLRFGISEEAVVRRCTGRGAAYCNHLRGRISFQD